MVQRNMLPLLGLLLLLLTETFLFMALAQSPSTQPSMYSTTDDGTSWEECEDGEINYPECPEDDDPEYPIYYPFPYNCRQYFHCINGTAHCFRCANGTIWDQENTECNHESEVNCTIITGTSTKSTTQRPTTTITFEKQ